MPKTMKLHDNLETVIERYSRNRKLWFDLAVQAYQEYMEADDEYMQNLRFDSYLNYCAKVSTLDFVFVNFDSINEITDVYEDVKKAAMSKGE